MLSVRALPDRIVYTESLGSEVSVQAQGWSMGFEMFRVHQEWSGVFGNDVHHFGNAY